MHTWLEAPATPHALHNIWGCLTLYHGAGEITTKWLPRFEFILFDLRSEVDLGTARICENYDSGERSR